MSKAKDILEKLKQRREAAETVRAYWTETLPDIGQLPEPQLQSWLLRFDLDAILAGLDAAVNQRSKLDAKGEPMTAPAALNFASAVMNKLHLEGLPEAEREKIKAHRDNIRAARSAAGKLGRAKQLAEEAKSCQEFAQVCPDLPEVARPLPSAYAFGFDCGIASASASASAADAAAAPPAAQPDKKGKEQPKPSNPTNPYGASGFSANQGKNKSKPDTVFGAPIAENVCPFHRSEMIRASRLANEVAYKSVQDVISLTYKCEKCYPPKRKIAKNGKPYPPGFDSWTNVERTEWLLCVCPDGDDFEDFRHQPHCPAKPKPSVASPKKTPRLELGAWERRKAAAATNDLGVEPL